MATSENDGTATVPALTIIAVGPATSGTQKGLDYYVHEIGSRWHKTTDGIFEVADLCVEATRTLPRGQLKSLIERVGFNKGTLKKLTKVGSDDRLRGDSVRPHLPNHYTILYDIARLSDAQLAAAIAEGVIRIDMRRQDLQKWLPKVAADEADKPARIGTIDCHADISDSCMAKLRAKLASALIGFPEIEIQLTDGEPPIRGFGVINGLDEAA